MTDTKLNSIEYRTQQQVDGKLRAIKASIEGIAVVSASSAPRHASSTNQIPKSQSRNSQHQSKSSSVMLIPLLIILGLGVFGFKRYEAITAESNTPAQVTIEFRQEPAAKHIPRAQPKESFYQEPATKQISWTPPKENFHCEAGKQHCSQMESCAEANFYINNCLGTKMDGDNDGIPCEKQHCGY
ncbi:excalibur calcium-binding domain-containing protein [Shewanella violacea]|uniref:Excalibur calcium-binding domain-containing protein n=1 Tax=Shewanella violacea (strain JCM 10179 / CIP 106290 / LMG 19151 / DSS12) TaxID=637905 RepID=D4ZEW5_SHEVD|nr:excalibur calcium-binding domain-containing protein [Shewanella violacea]BAJ00345.1 conserved hypothetical protein [Shewanella violacea DSS12]